MGLKSYVRLKEEIAFPSAALNPRKEDIELLESFQSNLRKSYTLYVTECTTKTLPMVRQGQGLLILQAS